MTNPNIHSTAIVHPTAKIGADVKIGPYCIVGERVTLGDRTVLHSHVVIDGNTTIGTDNQIFPFACLGQPTPDLKYKGEDSRLVIGDRNHIREYVTMHPGTANDRMETTVGNDCLFMVSVHVAHDCIVGNNVIMANCATLAGHVVVEDGVIFGGLCAVRQRVRVGRKAMIGGMTGVESDVIPYGLVVGERGHLAGLNLIGLERAGVEKSDINRLRHAFKDLFEDAQLPLSQRIDKVANDYQDISLAQEIVSFARDKGKLGLCLPVAK